VLQFLRIPTSVYAASAPEAMDKHAYPKFHQRSRHSAGDDRDRGDAGVVMQPVRSFFQTYPRLREFACGGSAGAISVMITFVPHKVMFRQQV
jgi:hypothetical protein